MPKLTMDQNGIGKKWIEHKIELKQICCCRKSLKKIQQIQIKNSMIHRDSKNYHTMGLLNWHEVKTVKISNKTHENQQNFES